MNWSLQFTLLVFIFGYQNSAFAAYQASEENLVSEEGKEDREAQSALDIERDATELIESRGFQVEEHNVHTKDGHILTTHRLLNPLVTEEERKLMKPVLLMHGLFTSSVHWIINSGFVRPSHPWKSQESSNQTDEPSNNYEQTHPNSLAYFLVNRGYDVWLGNMRGNTYAKRHERYTEWNPNFWNFTLDELAQLDLTAIIDAVIEQTGHSSIGYVGYSQGTTVSLSLLAEQPEYSQVLNPVIALAPIAFLDHMNSFVSNLLKLLDSPTNVNWWYKPGESPLEEAALTACKLKVVKKYICLNGLFLLVGFDEDELDPDRVDSLLSHLPEPTSVKIIAHYAQLARRGRFQHFDRGEELNQQAYGTLKPPKYPLGNIRSKLHLFIADNDLVASPQNVQELVESLNVAPDVVNLSEEVPKWNHIDFLFSRRVGLVLNPKIEQILRKTEEEQEEDQS